VKGQFPKKSLTTHMATFPEILMGFCSVPVNLRILKCVALSVPEIVQPKFGEVPGSAHAPFSPKF